MMKVDRDNERPKVHFALLTYEWYRLGRSRNFFGYEQHEHRKSKENWQPKTDFLPASGWQPEGQESEHRKHDAGYYDIEDIKERPPSDMQGVCQVWMRVGAAGIFPHSFLEADGEQLPLTVVNIISQINIFDRALEIHPFPRVNPWPES